MDLVLKNYEATVSCVETSAIFMHHFQEIAPCRQTVQKEADGADGGWWTTWGVSVTEILEASQQPQPHSDRRRRFDAERESILFKYKKASCILYVRLPR
jgi:hypothetical protein